ncbi:flagellar hook-basal body complex protein [Caloramator proteoclasticus]|uniref:Flagellar basal-body rod protein FlgG n=1 Tax=Caloramator proteoclasticus DSM 10124 TaxID=1121262 RepID=A0A1M4SS61_9CLOT|nr:flagellar hook-basal body complex protein [Caloramator proteoclasticus]SHE35001.1 flagellar basal-body rod protein FlgG [Caloramator proteoclasticus DSM 10124]
MIRGLYIASSGLILRQIQQENLSNNIANINNPGFKNDKICFKSFNEVLLQNYDKKVGNTNFKQILGTMPMGIGLDETKTDFSQGILEETGRNLDFAIEGDGFFTVLDNNKEYYTRNGRFKIDKDGYLTTTDNKRVLGLDENNQKVFIKIDSNNFKFNNNQIYTTSGNYRLYIVKGDMKKENENMYSSTNVEIDNNSIIHQNKIEKANIDTIEMITELISVMRNYESNQKVIQSIDDTLGKTVNEVGNVNR